MRQSGRRVVNFGLGRPLDAQDYGLDEIRGETWLVHGKQPLMPAAEIPLAGRHNLANVLAAMALAEAVGVAPEACLCGGAEIQGTEAPHRTGGGAPGCALVRRFERHECRRHRGGAATA